MSVVVLVALVPEVNTMTSSSLVCASPVCAAVGPRPVQTDGV